MLRNAFTYLEMLIVLALSSLLLMLAAVNFNLLSETTHDQLLKAQVLEAMKDVRLQAQINHITTIFCIANYQSHCDIAGRYILFATSTLINKFSPKSLTKLSPYQGFFHMQTFPNQKSYFSFHSDGMANNSNGTLWFCHTIGGRPVWAYAINIFGGIWELVRNTNHVINDSRGKPLKC